MPESVQLPLWGDGRKPLALRYGEWRRSSEAAAIAQQVTDLALARATAGAARISINLLFEQVRLANRVAVDNSFRALLARELRDRYPELQHRIHVKPLRGERAA